MAKLKTFSIFAFVFILAFSLFIPQKSVSYHEDPFYEKDTPPDVGAVVNDFDGVKQLYGNFSGGAHWVICPVDGPYMMSYVFQLQSINYEIFYAGGGSTGISGEPTWIVATSGHDGECAGYQEWGYSYSRNLPTSSLPSGNYNVKVWAYNTRGPGEYAEAWANFSLGSPTGTIKVSSNLYTGWTITGPENLQGEGTSVTYINRPTGTYTISPDNQACYSKSVSPSSTQTLGGGGEITFNITYTWVGCGGEPPPPPPTPGEAVLTVQSSGASAVSVTQISGSPSGLGGTTSYSRNSSSNISSARLRAPSSASGQNFISWTGCDSTQNPRDCNISVAVGESRSVTANFGSTPPPEVCSSFGHDDCAEFVSQTINSVSNPSSLTLNAGQTYPVTLTYRNTSHNTTWTCCNGSDINTSGGYKLGSQNWQDNTTWGQARTAVPTSVLPGQLVTFSFNITAPSTPGTYNFQRRMVSEFVRWFGDYSPNVSINVVGNNPPIGNLDAANCSIIGGWAFDPDTPSQEIAVHVYANGNFVTSAMTTGLRQDVNNAYGITGNHGFTIPTPASLKDGTNKTIRVYAIDSGGNGPNPEITNSPQTINCPPFNYSLSNSGNTSVVKTGSTTYGQNTITKNLISGVTEAVTITATGMPSGVSVSYDGNRSCAPTCSSTVTFAVQPSAPIGSHLITVTGQPLGRTTQFNLIISGNPSTVSCSSSPSGTAMIGQPVTWTATVSGGTPPYTYSWSGTNIPTNPAPSTNPYTITYTTIGVKNAAVTVTTSEGVQTVCSGIGPGGQGGSIIINFDPTFEEF